MSEPLLSDFFGSGATQDATTIVILKSDLDITAAANNRAEQLFAGILKKAATTATQSNYDTNPDRSIVIAPGFDSIVYRTIAGENESWQQTQYNINLSKPQISTGITPDDY